jgi:hypothetical protein
MPAPFWKILLGAALALVGGFLAKIWDEWRAKHLRRRNVFAFMADLLDSYTSTFSELVELQGQTGTIWIVILDRMLEEAPVFARNREHLILVRDTQLRRDMQSTVLKVHSTATLLKAALADEMAKQRENAAQAEQETAKNLTRHRFDQLRHQIDQVRDLRSQLAQRRPG